ncbi:MAG: type III-B CRISPR-associated protein Cas10/Cmr2 [Desulfobacula sp.]|jgi:CRISPR-associated protein Cmr2|nr:type III-B CRISPR-associated protein Cas10/Cmr2 [Desulfobacula sp.]MBT6338126.1 type III-B CRISPR-associated protein Cas10/Cmr2 [Desulfobacula sp.]
MTFLTPGTEYWNNKFAAFMHDPFDKVFQIPGHENRAAELIKQYGLAMPNDKFWRTADAMAAGFERGQVPSYSKDENKNGAIDYFANPVLTHPTSNLDSLKIGLPESLRELPREKAVQTIYENLLGAVKKCIGKTDDQSGYSGRFKGEPDLFAKARFFYTHLRLRFYLAQNNVASLGGFWHRIPADSRFPDHSIWQHNALTSAFYSCMELSGQNDDIGMMMFSITPVQAFIGRARKLRDYWTGSVILSWLAFEGIRWVCEHLGPDHILYPSLIDQPLMSEYLESEWRMDDIKKPEGSKDIASFPNKFLFLVPQSQAEDIGRLIKQHIKEEWIKLCNAGEGVIRDVLKLEKGRADDHIHSMFQRQTHDYWEFDWASVKMLSGEPGSRDEMVKFLPEGLYSDQSGVLEIFNEIIKDKTYYDKSGKGVFYSVTHSLVQSILAASKTLKFSRRAEENGEKCHLCGEFEILHSEANTTSMGAGAYKEAIKDFWVLLKDKWARDSDFGKNAEKLCTVCLMKRILYRVFESPQSQNTDNHVLYNMFHKNEMFPSTTYISLFNYYKRQGIDDPKQKQKVAQDLYENSADILGRGSKEPGNRDKYYAILMMDGDKMGRLVNGTTLASTWKSVLHPDMLGRLEKESFEAKYRDNWVKIFKKYPRRLLTPAIHAAISESLGDFAIYGVASIVKKYDGRLIYAGGDDVCAVLPVDTVLYAAREIKDYYNSAFQIIQPDGSSLQVKDKWPISEGKLSINLGTGKDISISAGILLCHHKENLSQMISNSHQLLNRYAKEKAGRNACAIELRKRSGGSRFFVRKWDDTVWDSFTTIGKASAGGVKDIEAVSRSLVYRLEYYRDGIEAIIKIEENVDNKLLTAFIEKQLERSSLGKSIEKEFAGKIANIVIEKNQEGDPEFKPEGLIVGSFLYGGEANEHRA